LSNFILCVIIFRIIPGFATAAGFSWIVSKWIIVTWPDWYQSSREPLMESNLSYWFFYLFQKINKRSENIFYYNLKRPSQICQNRISCHFLLVVPLACPMVLNSAPICIWLIFDEIPSSLISLVWRQKNKCKFSNHGMPCGIGWKFTEFLIAWTVARIMVSMICIW